MHAGLKRILDLVVCACHSGEQAARHTLILIRNKTDQRRTSFLWITFGPEKQYPIVFFFSLAFLFFSLSIPFDPVGQLCFEFKDFRALLQQFKWNSCSVFGRKLVTFYVITSIQEFRSIQNFVELTFIQHLCIIRQQQTLTECENTQQHYIQRLTKRNNESTNLSHRISNTRICSDILYTLNVYVKIYIYSIQDWIVPLLTLPNISNIMHAMERSRAEHRDKYHIEYYNTYVKLSSRVFFALMCVQ